MELHARVVVFNDLLQLREGLDLWLVGLAIKMLDFLILMLRSVFVLHT